MSARFSARQREAAAQALQDLHERQGKSLRAISHDIATTNAGIGFDNIYAALYRFHTAVKGTKGTIYNFGVRKSTSGQTYVEIMLEYLISLSDTLDSTTPQRHDTLEETLEPDLLQKHYEDAKRLVTEYTTRIDTEWIQALRQLKNKLHQEAGIAFPIIQEVYEERYTQEELNTIFN